ncbi:MULTISPECIES: PRC-barrel domain-containing protein [unclassified Nostoc]|uniref:PRC-barrel domain-containing protein n=1 Tax=unclassified Nostoc TaxID=2593658 RepID=UPI000B9577BA|nr:PRC-barrel domain-containing protein [Nostoc sp. 'Peltigera membranacea cyanobiont' 210A]OYD91538.1 photosystem reaction center subunit H [Nostoc sp. 'Peltigera membranacea cyanobiont' 210A]
MALYKLGEYNPNYKDEIFDANDIKKIDVYADDNRVGFVVNILVDESDGRFRYFIIDTGFWIFGKRVLLPVGLARLDYEKKHLFVPKLTKDQVKNLPEFSEDLAIDNDYEEKVRGVYRPLVPSVMPGMLGTPALYNYTLEPYFYELNDPNFRTYEENLRNGRNPNRAKI